jgi:hypothetical protein
MVRAGQTIRINAEYLSKKVRRGFAYILATQTNGAR